MTTKDQHSLRTKQLEQRRQKAQAALVGVVRKASKSFVGRPATQTTLEGLCPKTRSGSGFVGQPGVRVPQFVVTQRGDNTPHQPRSLARLLHLQDLV